MAKTEVYYFSLTDEMTRSEKLQKLQKLQKLAWFGMTSNEPQTPDVRIPPSIAIVAKPAIRHDR